MPGLSGSVIVTCSKGRPPKRSINRDFIMLILTREVLRGFFITEGQVHGPSRCLSGERKRKQSFSILIPFLRLILISIRDAYGLTRA